ncbi:MAG: pseudouridine-5'-phosphate glycosidase [Chloroflexota bacterium]
MIRVKTEVAEALAHGQPVVALESTLISHGLAYPVNVEVARELQEIVRRQGATPATVAVIAGEPRVGLEDDDIERLAQGRGIRKVSRRDIAVVIAKGMDGATTVASTMYLAHLVGITVFATGGIGGVHRGHPFDVSADLPELAQTPVIVVCAGAKSILDLPLTLEWLETQGVTVLGYGTSEFPAFYSRSSGLTVDAQVDTPEEVAGVWRAKQEMDLPGGLLVTAPVPEADEFAAAEAEAAIEQALAVAAAQGIVGKAVTPFILAEVARQTQGRSVQANLALLRNNASVAARIAVALAGVRSVSEAVLT